MPAAPQAGIVPLMLPPPEVALLTSLPVRPALQQHPPQPPGHLPSRHSTELHSPWLPPGHLPGKLALFSALFCALRHNSNLCLRALSQLPEQPCCCALP